MPKKQYPYLLLILILASSPATYSQGLRFNGNEHPIDNRTSYSVFGEKPVAFTDSFDVSFDLALYPETRIGYFLRIKNDKSSRIYNLFYDGQGGNIKFLFNEEGKSSLITAMLDETELFHSSWFRVVISFDLRNDSIKLDINGHRFEAANVSIAKLYHPVIIFGRSDHIIDVPSFAIKNLCVGSAQGDESTYCFALRENEGSVVHDSRGRAIGTVANPVWLINSSYNWRFVTSFQSATVAGSNYNPSRKEIYYFNRDSLYIYNVWSGESGVTAFSRRCPVPLALGTNFIDPDNDKLYAYEVYKSSPPYGEPTVASLDLDSGQWGVESRNTLPTQLHHHGSYRDPATGHYTIFGGFGNMYYNKNFYTFDLNDKKWHTVEDFKGDVIFPRYFPSVGYLEKTNSIYIFGGMGNESGEQVVGRTYFYDLHKVDLNTRTSAKLWEIPWDKGNIVPVRGMVILDDSYFYTLCYSEHYSDSFLKLYRFSLDDGSYTILGDSIPIHSERINTNANIYFDEQLKTIFAVVQEFDDDIVSDLKVYSLAFPPVTAAELTDYIIARQGGYIPAVILIAGIIATVGVLVLSVNLRRSKESKDTNELTTVSDRIPEDIERANSVYLFGEFTIYDRRGKDVTYMFSGRLRETFCLILQHSVKDGVTSQRLSNLLWPDKPQDKVKNSRGVTINHLRKALSELDGIELIYDKGCYNIIHTEKFYCDYIHCLQIISSGGTGNNRDELIRIISRGKFLKFLEQPLFDSFKEELGHKLEPVLRIEIEKSFDAEEYKNTLCFAEAMFSIDPLNDDALTFQIRALNRLKMNAEALIRYREFATEYKKIMGCNYPKLFKNL